MTQPDARLAAMKSVERFPPFISLSESQAVPEFAIYIAANIAPNDIYGKAGHDRTSFAIKVFLSNNVPSLQIKVANSDNDFYAPLMRLRRCF